VIGNVWEWCLDPWGEYTAEPATDPSRSGASGPRVIRGGGWNTVASDARSATRGATAQTFNNLFIGVRPARPLESE